VRGWYVSGPITGGTEYPRNLAKIGMLEVEYKSNSTLQNQLVRRGLHPIYII